MHSSRGDEPISDPPADSVYTHARADASYADGHTDRTGPFRQY